MTGATEASTGLEPWTPDPTSSLRPDYGAEPGGFMVVTEGDVKLHFLDWGRPNRSAGTARPGVLLLPGLLQPAWSWTPVARRLAETEATVVADLRGQGLSDSPMDGYDAETLGADALAVADGSGLSNEDGVVIAGHGFGGVVATVAAEAMGSRCAGLVLVDGGWERLEETTGVDVDEFLRGLDEPPEVMRSMAAWLGERRGFDPATWDGDQERAALDSVVETAAGHVVRAVRPHVVEAIVRTMFAWDPAPWLQAVDAPVTAIVALSGAEPEPRMAELRRVGAARAAAGRSPIRVVRLPAAHNLMRYRPADVTAAILETAASGAGTTIGGG
jgi:pimeloyl-ACP methyl ester carboxylesterase